MPALTQKFLPFSLIAVLALGVIASVWSLPAVFAQDAIPNAAPTQVVYLPIVFDSAGSTAVPPTPVVLPTQIPAPTPSGDSAFVESFDGAPINPTEWQSPHWDVTVHTRGVETLYQMTSMMADHGAHCEPPVETHAISAYEETVFHCRDHIMTAINDPGYGLIYLTPDRLVDFSGGEAVIRFDVSTFRKSGRDWIDLWITPFADNLQLPLSRELPDLSGEPRNALHIEMDFDTSYFKGSVIRDFVVTPIANTPDGWQGYETFLTPSQQQRDTFELRISATHIKFGMPGYGFYWIDSDIPALGWSNGVVQIGHHSYNPTKDCDGCGPNTWHWDNISINPALPFTMIQPQQRFVDETTGAAVQFEAGAPRNSYLRFTGIGSKIEVSFDLGNTWQVAQVQSQVKYVEEHFWSYWMPIPAGVDQVLFRGVNWWGGKWHVRDFSIWSLNPLSLKN